MKQSRATVGNTLCGIVVIMFAGSGSDHLGYARTWPCLDPVHNIDSLTNVSQIDSAMSLTRGALNCLRHLNDRGDTALAVEVERIGVFWWEKEQPYLAESLLTIALGIREAALGRDHPGIVPSLERLGGMLWAVQRLPEAERYYRRAVAILDRVGRNEDLVVAELLTALGGVCLKQDRITDAEPVLRRALAIKRKILHRDDPRMTSTLLNLGNACRVNEQFQESNSLFIEAIRILKKADGTDQTGLAMALERLGKSCGYQKRFEESEDLLRESLAIWERLQPMSADVVRVLFNLADVQIASGSLDEAETSLARADSIALSLPSKPYRSTISLNRAWLHRERGQYREAFEAVKPYYAAALRKRSQVPQFLTDEDILSFSFTPRFAQTWFLTCFQDLTDGTASDTLIAATAILDGKGWITELMSWRRDLLRSDTTLETRSVRDSLVAMRAELSALFVRGGTSDTASTGGRHFLGTRSRIDSLELAMVGRLATTGVAITPQERLIEDIVRSLPDQSVLVEYVRYSYTYAHHSDAAARYLALVLSHDNTPQIIDLGRAGPIDSLIENEFVAHFVSLTDRRGPPTNEDAAEFRLLSSRLSEKIWAPIARYVGLSSTVIIAPDGHLNRIAFAALTDEQGDFLIQGRAIHYVGAARDILRFKHAESSGSGILVVGDPQFDLQSLASKEPFSSGGLLELESEWRCRSVGVSCDSLSTLRLRSLPGTRREAQFVSESWAASHGDGSTTLLGADASEEGVRHGMPGRKVVHMATHGYALLEQCGPTEPPRWFEYEKVYVGESPLLLSGLILAGANQLTHQPVHRGVEDGILTAEEVLGLDLTHVELVVLSGCETGLGPTRHGDGAFGLRRAFHTAGARTVISSLWAIPDRSTVEYMRALYASGQADYPSMMRAASLKRLNELRENGLPDHPLTWGAFVAVGDWKKSW